jgi:hypothetical protein
MGKTTTSLEYAAFVKRPDGSLMKLHPFHYKTEAGAREVIQREKAIKCNLCDDDFKVMARTVIITMEDWHDI